jgi:hypothetical protein
MEFERRRGASGPIGREAGEESFRLRAVVGVGRRSALPLKPLALLLKERRKKTPCGFGIPSDLMTNFSYFAQAIGLPE